LDFSEAWRWITLALLLLLLVKSIESLLPPFFCDDCWWRLDVDEEGVIARVGCSVVVVVVFAGVGVTRGSSTGSAFVNLDTENESAGLRFAPSFSFGSVSGKLISE
jgi:hypothetical protein